MKTPILITGSRGMLGTDLVRACEEKVGRTQVIPTTSQSFDITNYRQVSSMLQQLRPKVIINAAAYTDVDGAEIEREQAFRINVIGPANLARVCEILNIKLIHFSTDHVFDGSKNERWTEEDEPHPMNYYAETKLLGEEQVLKYDEAIVLRVQWLYGETKERFTKLEKATTFSPFTDQFGAPTWTRQVSSVVVELLEKEVKGLFHFAYDDFASWEEVYEFVKGELDATTELTPQSVDAIKLGARRPKYSVLSNAKLLKVLDKPSMGSWKSPLKEFLDEVKSPTDRPLNQ